MDQNDFRRLAGLPLAEAKAANPQPDGEQYRKLADELEQYFKDIEAARKLIKDAEERHLGSHLSLGPGDVLQSVRDYFNDIHYYGNDNPLHRDFSYERAGRKLIQMVRNAARN